MKKNEMEKIFRKLNLQIRSTGEDYTNILKEKGFIVNH